MTARLLLWMVLAAWGLFALTVGALHLWIVPRINDWRPELESWATRAVGVPVKVGAIRARTAVAGDGGSAGFLPSLVPAFELTDVRLFDPAGREALHLPSVQAAVSVPSLWRLGFEQLVIASPVLDVRRTAEGRIEVAGLDFSGPAPDDNAAADWFFAQTEFVIQNGVVRWTDDLRAQPPLILTALDFVARNGGRNHQFRLDATPSPEWGERFSLRGRMREPLLDLIRGGSETTPWHSWSGELYADFPKADVSRLRGYLDLSAWQADVRSGQGAVRAWADVAKGRITGVITDLALQDVATRLGPKLPELALAELHGRLSAQWNEAGFEIASDNLRFRTQGGEDWPGGQLRLRHQAARGNQPANTSLNADRIELAALAAVATRLPLPEASRTLLANLQPAGRIEALDASWEGVAPAGAEAGSGNASAPAPAAWRPERYRAKGRVLGLALAGQARASVAGQRPLPGRPGVQGLTADVDLNQDGGQARLQIADGSVDLPGVFEEVRVPLTRFTADARWRVAGERIDAWLDKVRLANADAEGTASVHWHTSDPATSPSDARFPGVLDLTARLTRGEATRVHRYLPLAVGPDAQRYVRDAVKGGTVGPVDFRIQGDLWDVPFNQPGARGEFRITAQLKAVNFAYVPPFLQSEGDPAWPALKGVNGQLVLDRAALRLSQLDAGLDGAPGVRLSQAEVAIADLVRAPVLTVSASAQGPATEVLGFVRTSPVNFFTGQALERATINGPAQVQFKLQLPLEQVDKTTVQGSVVFAGNDLQITPDAPLLGRTTGRLSFSESGFTIADAQARVYGGELRFGGGMVPVARGTPRIQFRGQGSASAQGLSEGGLGFVSRLFGQASGNASYSAELGFRAGVPELVVTSTLQGLAINLPAPLAKAAADSLPLRYENRVLSVLADPSGEVARTDSLSVVLGPPGQPLAELRYERDITAGEPRVLRGSMAAGLDAGETVTQPATGVQANIRFQRIDADAWERVFTATTGTDVRASVQSPSAADSASLGYLPSSLAVRAGQLVVSGRSFTDVVVGGSREGNLWRANVDADELNGYIEYRQPAGNNAGNVYARLAHLNLAPAAAADVEQLLQQPTSMPALDIAIEDLVLSNRRLSRVEIVAQNRGTAARTREWQLTKLNIDTPEAQLSATGSWALPDNSAGTVRRTALNFKLDIQDAGLLLTRFGRPGVVRGGKGQIGGNIAWVGSPMTLDYPSLSGQLKADVQSGQFLKVEPGAAKLLGVLSLQALPRRLVLDFRDVFSEGFAFDFVRGDASIEQGVARTNNLQMKGINAAALMEGSADIAREQQDLKVVVVPEINAGTAALIATAINPPIGLGTFLAQFLLRQPLQSATTQQFHITGSWADPQVEKLEKK
ncbi:MAG: TIGR02099 family protein [Hydrogenophaga sp.]|uniref:YhdP family protein n=1 Tax=Hydrogenophaga sp. TaxID=1904254 RepID=UPI0025C032B1|nr:YhdP family protein [Hydrogenophaga sp.]MCG2655024.1 TIGR02099 family protein [Hydrogenophaga sp.]